MNHARKSAQRRTEPRTEGGGRCADGRGRCSSTAARLQSGAGNRAVQALAERGALQAKLEVGAARDRAEREADRVADAVVSAGPAGEPGSSERDSRVAVNRSGTGGSRPLEGERASAVRDAVRGGRPLRAGARSYFEERMGADFGDVRIHVGSQADAAARAVNARAFTLGRDVVFRSGAYDPRSREGKRLIAHELTHVVQQAGRRTATSLSRTPNVIQRDASFTPFRERPDDEDEPRQALSDSCVRTRAAGGNRVSTEPIVVAYSKEEGTNVKIYLRKRGESEDIVSVDVPPEETEGTIRLDAGIRIDDENARYLLRMTKVTSEGTPIEHVGNPVPIRFQVCALRQAPAGDDRTFARMLYAEGTDAGEFAWIRDLVYNRIEWVRNCPDDERHFGEPTVSDVLTHPRQFESVLNQTAGFRRMEQLLNNRAGPCEFTTSPRQVSPNACRRVNAAIEAVDAGNENSHDYVFFRSDTNTPSPRATNRGRYPGGNYYWEISGCQ